MYILNCTVYRYGLSSGTGLCMCTCAARGSLLDKVSQLTVADEGAFRVLAVTVETDVLVQITLVHIWTVIDNT